jgi:hypothetical protein
MVPVVADKPLPFPRRSCAMLMIGGGLLLAVVVSCLWVLDSRPWPTIGAACVTYIFAVYYVVCDGTRDVQLSYFLTSQLVLAYFSAHDPGKEPDGDSPLATSANFRHSNKHLRTGLAAYFQDDDVMWLERLEHVCVASWLAAILISLLVRKENLFLGWRNKLVFVVLSVSYVVLHGIMAGLNGVSHRFYMAAYSFVGLLLEAVLGVDSHPYVCLFAGFTFFSAGISKLRNSRLSWLNGQALCRYIGKEFVGTFQWFCSIMAPMSILFELGAPFLMFFGSHGRIAFVLLALSFHFAIAILMYPRYTSQACAYALVFRTNLLSPKPKRPLLLTVITVILLLTTVFRIEVWPLTSVPMYSIDLPDNFGATIEEAYRIATIVDKTQCFSGFQFPYSYLDIRLRGSETCKRGVWRLPLGKPKVIHQVLILGLASALRCKESGKVACTTQNKWFDMYGRAVWDECQMDSMHFSLLMGTRYIQFHVYTWESDKPALTLLHGQEREEL